VWRDPERDAWVLLVRHHEGPDGPVVRRVALEIGLRPEGSRCVALPPEAVGADDSPAKKVQNKDGHPFLSLLRRHLVGARAEDLRAVPNDRIAILDAVRDEPAEDDQGPDAAPRHLRLAVELMTRGGNLILSQREALVAAGQPHADGEPGTRPACLGSLLAGKTQRPFEPGAPYKLPRPREHPEPPPPSLALDTDPNPETLALGLAVAEVQRAAEQQALEASRHAQLGRAIRQALQRQEGVVRKLEQQLDEIAQADHWERQGDLLKANLALAQAAPRGATEVEVPDYMSQADPPPLVTIPLDPTKTVHEHLKALFKKAKKLRKGEGNVQLRLGEIDARRVDLLAADGELAALAPDDADAIDALESKLIKLGALPKPKQARAKAQVNQGPRAYRTLEGHEILVGRSDEENDQLTMRTARGRDLFFHVSGCPGSHVILRVDPKRPPNHESLLDAASVAVHFSKARNRGRVDVSYTPRKWVKKPKGAKPGLVQIWNQKTVRAGGDQARLERVLNTRKEDEA
jgi:predicted ribosome quality control (RQC) complex YloA/Tae2 family protein